MSQSKGKGIDRSPYAGLETPAHCTADFCIVPIGTASPSVSAHIALVQRLLQSSGLSFTMHSAGTTVEGPWDEVHHLIGQAHTLLHRMGGVPRVQTDVRIGTRTDKHQTFNDKVAAVERLLAEEGAGAEAQCQGPVVDENNDSNLTNPSGHNSSGGPITGCDGNDTGKDRTEKDVAKGILQRVEPGRLGGVEVSKEWGPL